MSDEIEELEARIATIKIESRVPLRPRYPHGSFSLVAKKMKVGDSVWSDDDRIITGIGTHLTKGGFRYETRSEKNGRRIWKLAPREEQEPEPR